MISEILEKAPSAMFSSIDRFCLAAQHRNYSWGHQGHKLLKKIINELKEKDRNKILSIYILKLSSRERIWSCKYPLAICSKLGFAVVWKGQEMIQCSYKGHSLKELELCPSDKYFSLFNLEKNFLWQELSAQASFCPLGCLTDPANVLFITDSRNDRIYRIEQQKSRDDGSNPVSFFQQNDDGDWEPIFSVNELDDKGMFERIGIDGAQGWKAKKRDEKIDLEDATGEACYRWDKDGLVDLKSGLVAMDMTAKGAATPYAHLINLDPRTQVWCRKDPLTPSRIVSPHLGMEFQIDQEGKIWGRGEWEGFEVLPNPHLSSLPHISLKLVLHHPSLGTRVMLPAAEMSLGKELSTPMTFTPKTGKEAKWYTISVEKNGALLPKTREEALYLASLFFHLRRPFAALCCLKSCDSTDSYTLEELRLLKTCFTSVMKQKEIRSIALLLKLGLLIQKSHEKPAKPWQLPKNPVEKSEQEELQKFFLEVPGELTEPFTRYLSQIVSVPKQYLLSPEEIEKLRLSCPKIAFSSAPSHFEEEPAPLLVKDLLKDVRTEIDRDFFAHHVLPVRGSFELAISHFLSFYAIAREGNPQQKADLRAWMLAFRTMHDASAKITPSKQPALANFFLKLLAIDPKKCSSLPSVEDMQELYLPEVSENNRIKKIKELLDLIQKEPLPQPTVLSTTPPILAVRGHEKALRKQRLNTTLPLDPKTSRLSMTEQTFQSIQTGRAPFLTKEIDTYFSTAPKTILLDVSSPRIIDTGKTSAAYKKAFSSLQQGVKNYVEKQNAKSPLTLTHSQKLLKNLQTERAVCEEAFRKSKAELLAKIGKPTGATAASLSIQELEHASLMEKPIRWSDMLFLFAKQDANAYLIKQPLLSPKAAQELYNETALCLAQQVRLQRLEKGCRLLSDPALSPEKTETLFQLLTEKRGDYPVGQYPMLLLFEALAGIELRKDQMAHLKNLVDPNSHWLIEAIMGSGKSEVLIPLFAQGVADGNSLSLAVVPKEQMLSAGTRLEKRLKELFLQNSVQINWQDSSLANLQAIHKRLEEAISRREVVRLYTDELQHFFLQEQSLRYQYVNLGERGDLLVRIDAFVAIRKILKEKGVALVDEVHMQLMRKRECQKPLGAPTSVEIAFRKAAVKLQELLVTDKEITETFLCSFSKKPEKGGKAVPFVKELHEVQLRELIARAFAKKSCGEEQKEKVIAFLTTPQDQPAPLQGFSEKDCEVLAFVRGQLHTILPTSLSKKWGEDYGCFPPSSFEPEGSLLAGPYRGKDKPVIGSTFASPDETLAFTVQSYLITGVPKAILARIVEQLKTKAKARNIDTGQAVTATAEYEEYVALIGGEKALGKFPFEATDYEKLAQAINQNRGLLLGFVEKHILSHVQEYSKTASTNGLSFFRLFRAVKGVSGTLHAAFTLHHRFQKSLRPDIEGEAFALLSKNPKPLLLQQGVKGNALLHQLFSSYKSPCPRALIDQGALMEEDALTTAKQILLFTQSVKPPIDRVIYFSGDEQYVLERGGAPPKKYDPKQSPPETSFTFYDQSHATGTDIAQADGATAWVTVSDTTSYADVCQAGFRMRGLATQGQSVHFVASYELVSALALHKVNDITTADILSYAKHLQAKQLEEEQYKAILEQLKDCFLEKIQQLIDRNPAHRALLEETLRNNKMDPTAAYASAAKWLKPEEHFASIRDGYIKTLQDHYSKADLAPIQEEMQGIIQRAISPEDRLVPDLVLSHTSLHAASELEMEQQVELQQESVQQVQQQQQLNLETVKIKHLKEPDIHRDRLLFTPEKWAKTLQDHLATDQTGTMPEAPLREESIMPIYRAAAFLEFSTRRESDSHLEHLAKALPAKLHFSLNVICSGGVDFFQKNQFHLETLLLVPDPKNPKEPYLIALSKKESELWFQAIAQKTLPKSLQEAFLFSPTLDFRFGKGLGRLLGDSPEFSPQVLHSEKDEPLNGFEQALTLAKWMMGNVRMYTQKELRYLESWLAKAEDLEALEKIFKDWFFLGFDLYEGSPLERAMKKCKEARFAPRAPLASPAPQQTTIRLELVVPQEVNEVMVEENMASTQLPEQGASIPTPFVLKDSEKVSEISPDKPPQLPLTSESLNPSKPAPRIFIRLLRGASFPFFLAWNVLTFPFRFIWNRLRRKNST